MTAPLQLTAEMRGSIEGRGDRMLDAYYFCFDSTGDPDIDLILGAVARAGKLSHSTEWWDDEDLCPPGAPTSIQIIQAAANNAAANRKKDLNP